jgi:hypothetical protein
MQKYKVAGVFEMVVYAYSEEHLTDIIRGMDSINPDTGEQFLLHADKISTILCDFRAEAGGAPPVGDA